MIDHLQLVVRDLGASRRFYAALMSALDIPPGPAGDDHFSYDEMWVSTATSAGASGELTGRVHVAFAAKDRATVEAAFTGNHGWFWRNRGNTPVTVTLRTNGAYNNIRRVV